MRGPGSGRCLLWQLSQNGRDGKAVLRVVGCTAMFRPQWQAMPARSGKLNKRMKPHRSVWRRSVTVSNMVQIRTGA